MRATVPHQCQGVFWQYRYKGFLLDVSAKVAHKPLQCAAAAAATPTRLHGPPLMQRVQRHCALSIAGAAPVPRSWSPAVVCAASSSGGYQRPLTTRERKDKRAESQRLGRNLCTVNLGQKGLTPAFLDGFKANLAANELVKVKVGSCDESPEDVVEALTAVADCVLVHKIGFTLTFYRDKSLPPPPPAGLPTAAADGDESGSDEEAGSGEGREGAAGEDSPDALPGDCVDESELAATSELDPELAVFLMEDEDAFSDSDSEGEGEEEDGDGERQQQEGGGQRAGSWQRRQPDPPEFTVIG